MKISVDAASKFSTSFFLILLIYYLYFKSFFSLKLIVSFFADHKNTKERVLIRIFRFNTNKQSNKLLKLLEKYSKINHPRILNIKQFKYSKIRDDKVQISTINEW